MATYTASTTAQLLKFVGTATGGDTILLKAGTYSAVTIANVIKTGNVTISSADAGHPAVLTDLTIKSSAGLTLSGLELFGTRDLPFQVQSSSRIVLDKLDVHGSLDGTSSDDYRGMLVRDSNDVTVSNSHFHELTDALSHLDSRNVAFTGNSFDTIRDNGIVGGGTSNIAISKNTFTNFDHVGDIHPDAIQFWTTNTTTAAHDITVSGNTFTRGAGSVIQGVWINDDLGNLPYTNVTVTNNAIIGGAYNGIVVSGAVNATLSGNVVIGTADQQSWIGVRNVAAASITDNAASSYNFSSSGVTEAGNVQTAVMATPTPAARTSGIAAASVTALKLDVSNAVTYAGVSVLGFIDAPTTTGHKYTFTETRFDGTIGADRLSAGAIGASHLYGYDGNDSLIGSKNGIASTLEGGKGDDTYTIYQAQDIVIEQANEGTDTVYAYANYTLGANVENLRASAAGLTLHGNGGANTLVAHAGGSVLYGEAGDDVLQGGAGDDRLFGGAGNDRITSGGGNDYIEGGAGNDVLIGGAGKNTILGGDGNDTIEGGAGLDKLTGGLGADTFVFRNGDFNPADMTGSRDIITDFKAAEGDKLSLSLIDANTKTAGDDAFSFIGNQAFHGVAGELRYAADGDGITVFGDTNGDKIADLSIHLSGVTTIVASSMFL